MSATNEHAPGHGLFKHLFLPATIGFAVVLWVFHERVTAGLKASALPTDFTTVTLLFFIALISGAEVAYPANPRWQYHLLTGGEQGGSAWHGLGRDLFYFFFVTQLSVLLVNTVATRLEAWLSPLGVGYGVAHLWPTEAPMAVKVALAFFLMELFSYGTHRAAHTVPFLWRFHRAHHVVTELSALKALRTHPVDNLFFAVARSIPVLLLGAGAEEVTGCVYFAAILSLVAHANVDVEEGPLGWVVNSPRYHAVHHSADVPESMSNFGCHTIAWDRLFRTFRSKAAEPLEIGVKPVGRRTIWQELFPFSANG